MKKAKLITLFCFLFSFAKAQVTYQTCDTIILKSGLKFTGVLTKIKSRSFTLKNCDTTGFPIINIKKSDVKSISGNYKKRFKSSSNTILDTACYLHIGIIPYEVLSRSSGLYIGYDFKNISLEYRPTYTYATNLNVSGIGLFNNDNWSFQGINNSIILYKPLNRRTKIGTIISYKYWWHNKLSIDNNASSYAFDDAHFKESKSVYMNGVSLGI